jgi:hypothetical protein
MMRTTCVATQLEGGHATNALPQLAAANVNCRLLPDDSVERVAAELTRLVADDQVKITITVSEGASPASPLRPDITKAFNHITDTMWPGVVTVPTMAVGGSDCGYRKFHFRGFRGGKSRLREWPHSRIEATAGGSNHRHEASMGEMHPGGFTESEGELYRPRYFQAARRS